MRSLVKFLIVVVILGIALQQGWPQAGSRFVAGLFGAHAALVPEGGVDGLAVTGGLMAGASAGLSGLLDQVRALPDPWYTLTLMTAGVIGVMLLVALVRTTVRTTLWLGGRLRDVWV